MRKLLFIFIASFTVSAHAQIIWGSGSSNPNYDNAGKFATPFGIPGGWTPVGVSSPTALWTRTMNGLSQGAYAGGLSPISSNSQVDGVALFDSDFLDNNGVQGAFGTGSCPAPHKGQLVSPIFDLSGYTDTKLKAKFLLQYRDFQINELSIGFSSDGGNTFTDFSINQNVGANNMFHNYVSLDLTGVTNGVTDLTQCQIRLTFDGRYYFAMIDDISIEVIPPYDFAIEAANSSSNLFAEKGTSVLITSNRFYPISQLAGYDLYFGANIKNKGFVDALPEDSVKLNMWIKRLSTGGTWTTVYSQSILIDKVFADNYGTLRTETISNTDWIQTGDYRAYYNITSYALDGDLNNNSTVHSFSITNNDYASKVPRDSINHPQANSIKVVSSAEFMEWGSIYSFPKAGDSNMKIDSVSFAYGTYPSFVGNPNQTVKLNIYEWNDANQDGYITDYSELVMIGEKQINLTGLSAGKRYTKKVGGMLEPNTGKPMSKLQNNKLYFVSILINPGMFGGPTSFTSNDVIALGASDNRDYSLNYVTDPNSFPSPVIVGNQGASTFYGGGFGGQFSPSFGLHLTTCSPTTGKDVITSCSPIRWIDGIVYTSSNTTAKYTIQNIAGCDSVVTLNLTIPPFLSYATTTNASTITAIDAGQTYLWIDCVTKTPIANETNQSFTATKNGSYAVIVNNGTCSDTSMCVAITTLDIALNKSSNTQISVYPNPNNGEFTITASVEGTYNIVNQLGQIVQSVNLNSANNFSFKIDHLNNGIYFIMGYNNNRITKEKIIVVN